MPAYRLVGWGTMPLGALLGGVLAEALGLRATFLVAAGIALAHPGRLPLPSPRRPSPDAEAAEAPTG